jgi:ribosomal-protein-alanine N-acetyltransferase
MESIIFETVRLVVRPYTEEDRENFYQLNGDAEVMRFIRPAKTKEECDQFLLQVIAAAAATPLYGRWAAHSKASGEFIGSFAVIPVENSCQMQMGYALLPKYWGKGYATELTRAGLEYVFSKTPLEVIYGYTEMPNTASQKVLLKCGFKSIGTIIEREKELARFVFKKKDYTINTMNAAPMPRSSDVHDI